MIDLMIGMAIKMIETTTNPKLSGRVTNIESEPLAYTMLLR